VTPIAGLAPVDPLVSRPVMASATAILSTLIVCSALLISTMDRWHRRASLSRLYEALEAMSDGLAYYDAEDRLMVWNGQYARINPETADHRRQGIKFEQILRAGLDQGYYPEALGREV